MRRTVVAALLVLLPVMAGAQDFIRYYPSTSRLSVPAQISNVGLADGATYGPELVSNGTFATGDLTGWSGANWSYSSGKALHAAGSVAALTQNITVVDTALYEVTFTISGASTGSVAVSVGAVSIIYQGVLTAFDQNLTRSRSFVAAASGAVALNFTPTNGFDGSLDDISVKAIFKNTTVPLTIYDSAGTANVEIRGNVVAKTMMFGFGGLSYNSSGTYNHGFGYGTLYNNTAGTSNTAFGYAALGNNTNGNFNTAIGDAALNANTTGPSNTAIGLRALAANTTGSNNTSVGDHSIFTAITASNNTAIGFEALYLTTSSNNTAIGSQALRKDTTGDSNTAFGNLALYSNTSGAYSTALGYNALAFMAGGTLPYNTAIGANAGSESGATPTVDNRVTSGTKLTFIGANSGLGSATQRTNSTVVGSEAYVDSDNTVVLGDENVTSVLASSDGGAVVTASAIKIGANTGITGTVVVKGSDGNNCNLVFEGGIVTSETCP